jgi:hypothetical protein
MSETFSQDSCTVDAYHGGLVSVYRRDPDCMVRVADGELTAIRESGKLVFRVPTDGLEIITPLRRRHAAGAAS